MVRFFETSFAHLLIWYAEQMKDVVQNLYNLIVQAYDHRGTNTELAMREEMYNLASFKTINSSTDSCPPASGLSKI